MHLLWSLVAGLGPGLLVVLLVSVDAPAPLLVGGALLGGVLLAAAVWALERSGGYEAERGRYLGQAASAGLLAWLAMGALLLELPPHRMLAPALALAALGAALWLATRRRGPAPGWLRHAGQVATAMACFALLLVVLAALSPPLLGIGPLAPGAFSSGAWDVDAGVALEPRRICEPRVEELVPLADRGAHPRLAGEGRYVFFDAEADGARQVFRLDRESGVVRCLTCGQPGGNRRPAPTQAGNALVFDSDRHRSWRHPMNTELYALEVSEDGRDRSAIRLTRDLRPDDHALYDPSGRGILWTRTLGPEFAVVRGAIRGGHGGVILTGTSLVRKGGLHWPSALDWAPDARTLALGFGHAVRPLALALEDPATGEALPGPDRAAHGASVSFSRDGQRMAVVSTRPSGAASLLPRWLGFLVGRLEPWLWPDGVAGPGGTRLLVGPKESVVEVDLGDVAAWGSPTGFALSPEGDAGVLGQRREVDGEIEERLLWLRLPCRADGS